MPDTIFKCVKPATNGFPVKQRSRSNARTTMHSPWLHLFFIGSSTYDRAIGLRSRSDLLSRKREAYDDTAAVLSRDRRD